MFGVIDTAVEQFPLLSSTVTVLGFLMSKRTQEVLSPSVDSMMTFFGSISIFS